MQKPKCTAIVLAGGSGKRMGTKVQKQYLEIDENTDLMGLEIATHVIVKLQTNDAPGKAKVIKQAERDGLYAALDLGEFWLTDILSEE